MSWKNELSFRSFADAPLWWRKMQKSQASGHSGRANVVVLSAWQRIAMYYRMSASWWWVWPRQLLTFLLLLFWVDDSYTTAHLIVYRMLLHWTWCSLAQPVMDLRCFMLVWLRSCSPLFNRCPSQVKYSFLCDLDFYACCELFRRGWKFRLAAFCLAVIRIFLCTIYSWFVCACALNLFSCFLQWDVWWW